MKVTIRGYKGYILSMYANTEDKYCIRKGLETEILSYDIELLVQERGIKSVNMESVLIDEIYLENE